MPRLLEPCYQRKAGGDFGPHRHVYGVRSVALPCAPSCCPHVANTLWLLGSEKQNASPEGLAQVLDSIGGPCGIRTRNQRIMSPRESPFFDVEQYADKTLNDGKTREKAILCIA